MAYFIATLRCNHCKAFIEQGSRVDFAEAKQSSAEGLVKHLKEKHDVETTVDLVFVFYSFETDAASEPTIKVAKSSRWAPKRFLQHA